MADDINRDTTVVNVAVLMDRFDRHDKDIQSVESSLRDIDRGQQSMRTDMAMVATRMEQAMDLARNIETSTTAKVAALDLRLTAVQADMATRFATLKSDVGAKVSTSWVRDTWKVAKDILLIALAIGGALGFIQVKH